MLLSLITVVDALQTRNNAMSGIKPAANVISEPFVTSLPLQLPADILLVLHKTQFSAEYVAKATIPQMQNAEPTHDPDESRYAHLCWVHKHWNRIRGIIFVSNVKVPDTLQLSITSDMLSLPVGSQRPLGFSDARALNTGLRRISPPWELSSVDTNQIQDLIDELCGHGRLDTALQCLRSIFPIGLSWSSCLPNSPAGLHTSVCNKSLVTSPFDLEQKVIERLVAHVNGSAKGAFRLAATRQQEWLDRHVADGAGNWIAANLIDHNEDIPTTFDQALRVLAASPNYNQWETRLVALRECLLSEG